MAETYKGPFGREYAATPYGCVNGVQYFSISAKTPGASRGTGIASWALIHDSLAATQAELDTHAAACGWKPIKEEKNA